MEKQRRIAMISGHLDITSEDFEKHYVPQLKNAIDNRDKFIMGDARGVDFMALDYLIKNNIPKEDIKVYYQTRSWGVEKYDEKYFQGVKGDYKSITERDARMTNESDYDIAWVRSKEESKKLYGEKFNPKRISGTERNILRRKKINK